MRDRPASHARRGLRLYNSSGSPSSCSMSRTLIAMPSGMPRYSSIRSGRESPEGMTSVSRSGTGLRGDSQGRRDDTEKDVGLIRWSIPDPSQSRRRRTCRCSGRRPGSIVDGTIYPHHRSRWSRSRSGSPARPPKIPTPSMHSPGRRRPWPVAIRLSADFPATPSARPSALLHAVCSYRDHCRCLGFHSGLPGAPSSGLAVLKWLHH